MFSPRTSPCIEMSTRYRRSTRPRKGLSAFILSDCADVAVPGLRSTCFGVTEPSLSGRDVATLRLPGSPEGGKLAGKGALPEERRVGTGRGTVPPDKDPANTPSTVAGEFRTLDLRLLTLCAARSDEKRRAGYRPSRQGPCKHSKHSCRRVQDSRFEVADTVLSLIHISEPTRPY